MSHGRAPLMRTSANARRWVNTSWALDICFGRLRERLSPSEVSRPLRRLVLSGETLGCRKRKPEEKAERSRTPGHYGYEKQTALIISRSLSHAISRSPSEAASLGVGR